MLALPGDMRDVADGTIVNNRATIGPGRNTRREPLDTSGFCAVDAGEPTKQASPSSARSLSSGAGVADAGKLRKVIPRCGDGEEAGRVKIIMYSGAELLTGDEIAIGVLRYCEALAGSVAAEMIEIPVREPDGSVSRVMLLVGPTSQIIAKEAKSEWDELVDPDVMRRLGERTRAQRNVAHVESHHPADHDSQGTSDSDEWRAEY